MSVHDVRVHMHMRMRVHMHMHVHMHVLVRVPWSSRPSSMRGAPGMSASLPAAVR